MSTRHLQTTWQERQQISAYSKHFDCHGYAAQMWKECEYFTFLNFDKEMLLLWNFLESWEMLRSCTLSFLVRSFSSSGTVVTSLEECAKAKSRCGKIMTNKRQKQQQKQVTAPTEQHYKFFHTEFWCKLFNWVHLHPVFLWFLKCKIPNKDKNKIYKKLIL